MHSYRLGTPLRFFFFFIVHSRYSTLSSFLSSRLLDGITKRWGPTAVHNNTVRLSFVSARLPVFSLRTSVPSLRSLQLCFLLFSLASPPPSLSFFSLPFIFLRSNSSNHHHLSRNKKCWRQEKMGRFPKRSRMTVIKLPLLFRLLFGRFPSVLFKMTWSMQDD